METEIRLLDYGATITHWFVNGIDIVLGFEDPQEYLKPDNPYFGAVIGRSCNRTAGGKCILNGQLVQLPVNNGPNSLHGGHAGFDKQLWKVVESTDTRLVMEYTSFDGDQGYPGSLRTQVTFALDPNTHTLSISFECILLDGVESYVNLTTHPYFNLGSETTILDHVMVTPGIIGHALLDDDQIPIKPLVRFDDPNPSVETTSLDFRTQKPIGRDLKGLRFRGYDHYLVSDSYEMTLLATVKCLSSRIQLDVSSNAPGCQFYTGNWVDCVGKRDYQPYSGFCLEPSFRPNAINDDQSRNHVLITPASPWHMTIVYRPSIF